MLVKPEVEKLFALDGIKNVFKEIVISKPSFLWVLAEWDQPLPIPKFTLVTRGFKYSLNNIDWSSEEARSRYSRFSKFCEKEQVLKHKLTNKISFFFTTY